jgi:mono/diheme cytochrome c family protein
MLRTTGLLLCSLAVALAQDSKQPPKVVEKPEERGVGAKVGASAFVDGLLKDGKLAVVAFTATDCPMSKLYRPKLQRLELAYATKGVTWAWVFCNFGDKPDIDGAVHDRDGAIAALLGAKRTTEVFVIDAGRVLRYRGAVDDQYGLGYERDAPKETYLVDAVDALLAGQPVKVGATEPWGCAIEHEMKPGDGTVTYHRDVAPILQKRCAECHRPGEIGPFSLLTYDKAKSNAKRIKEVVQKRIMPPWHADPKHGEWLNDRRLSDAEIESIVKWVDGGAPEGDAKDAPAPRSYKEGWAIGEPDAVFKMPRAYKVPAEGAISYQYFRVKTSFVEDRWIKAMEVRPGARKVVHHILVFIEYPRDRRKEQPIIDGGLFYGYFAVMVPGEQPNLFLPDTGKLLPAGASLIFQVHYTANGEETRDVSQIGMLFHKEPPKHEVFTRGAVNTFIRIPPNKADHEETATFRFESNAKILSFLPHMHVRGKAFRYVLLPPDGPEEILLDIPAYDFRWQTIYRLKEPRFVTKGTKIKAIARYDNSKDNPANPDPSKTVHFGDQTWDEMLIGYIDFIKVD